MAPKVSIIVSSYNQEAYVREAMDSALGQTYPNIEVVATDNGSTDGTQDVFNGYRADKRVKLLFRRENGPLNTLANEATALCCGEFISLLHGDDYYLPEKIRLQVECISRLSSEYGVVYSPNYRLNEITGERWLEPCLNKSGYILKNLLLDTYPVGPIPILSPLTRRACFIRYPFREEFFLEGEAIFLRMAMGYKFQFLDEPLTVMRDHLSNMGKAIRKNRDVVLPVYDKLAQESEFPRELIPALGRHMGCILRNYGWQGIRVMEDPQWARECFVMALRHDKAQAFHPRTMAGLCLSALPRRLISALNRAANRFIRHKENVVSKEGYR